MAEISTPLGFELRQAQTNYVWRNVSKFSKFYFPSSVLLERGLNLANEKWGQRERLTMRKSIWSHEIVKTGRSGAVTHNCHTGLVTWKYSPSLQTGSYNQPLDICQTLISVTAENIHRIFVKRTNQLWEYLPLKYKLQSFSLGFVRIRNISFISQVLIWEVNVAWQDIKHEQFWCWYVCCQSCWNGFQHCSQTQLRRLFSSFFS